MRGEELMEGEGPMKGTYERKGTLERGFMRWEGLKRETYNRLEGATGERLMI